jgi:WD40 repeat protein
VGELAGRPIAISGGTDGTVRVWDLAEAEPASVIDVWSAVESVGTRDGMIVVGASDGLIGLELSLPAGVS